MTQPPQWGGPPPPRPPYQQQHRPQQQPQYRQPGYPPQGHQQQGYPQQPPRPPHQQGPWLPPKPAQLTVLALLDWVLAVAMFLLAAFVVVSFLMSGSTLLIGVLLAVVIGGIGALNALAALSINHPHFPNTLAAQMAGTFTALVLVIALMRSVRRGVAELVPSLGSFALLLVCVASLVLATRPAVKQWIAAKHRQSIAQGHVPRNRR